jgi:hypothetical protein
MRKFRLAAALILFSGFALTQLVFSQSVSRIDASAIWQVTPQFLATAPEACAKKTGDSNGDCLVAEMAKAGAPSAAVTFARALNKQSHGDFGVMAGFHSVGPVDFAFISYPLRANTNYGLALVNGTPSIVNVEDLTLLDKKGMEQSFQFQDLKVQFPKISLWPGDRDGKIWPDSQPGPTGGKQFTLNYPLRNGCHACEHGGDAIFTWNFDAQGKFLGTTFVGMTPPPLNQH